jgi:hypothetical protein
MQSPPFRLLSFDVGIKNLSFVDLSFYGERTTRINGWDVIDVTEGSDNPAKTMRDMDELTQRTLTVLRDRFFAADAKTDAHYDWVIIENQPANKNPVMKTMQVTLYTFFQTVKMLFGAVSNVRLVSAMNKIPTEKGAPKLTYAQKKKRGVELCRERLRDDPDLVTTTTTTATSSVDMTDTEYATASTHAGMESYSTLFERHKKKDDLADTFLQATVFISRHLRCP